MSPELRDTLIHIAELVAVGIVGGLVATLASHKLTARRERDSGVQARRRQFLGLVTDIREYVTVTDDPEHWVMFFKNNAPALKAEFAKIVPDLGTDERLKIADAVSGVLAFANKN